MNGFCPRVRVAVFVLSVSITHVSTLEAQGEPRPEAGFQEDVSVGYVLVPVVARSRGGYARKLTVDDFQVRVDGQTVGIESFDVGASAPITIVFLQDLSGSMANAGKLGLSRLTIARLMSNSRPGDRLALATFANGEVHLEVDFTHEPRELERAMGLWKPLGVTALHDAVSRLPELTDSLQSSKRAAILITDGADNASEIEPGEARRRVQLAELPVYVLGLATGSPEVLDREGAKLHRYADVLNLLAHLTGGKYFWISNVNDVVRASGAIASDLRHQYVLGFPTIDSEASRYREIEVATRKKNVVLTYRRGYEGPPPAAFAGDE